MSYQCSIRRLAASWNRHLYSALYVLLEPYQDIPLRTLIPFAPIAPSVN